MKLFHLVILLFAAFSWSQSYAGDETTFSVDKAFDILYANEKASKQLHDSLFVPMDKEQWISTFLRRAKQNGYFHQDNEQHLQQLRQYLKRDSLSQEQLLDFFDRFRQFSLVEVNNDPFLSEEFCQLLMRQVDKLDMSDPYNIDMKTELQRMLASTEYSISLFGDTAALYESYHLYRDLADNYDPSDTLFRETIAGTQIVRSVLALLSTPEFGRQGIISVDDLRHYLRLYEQYQADSAVAINVGGGNYEYIPAGSPRAEAYHMEKEFYFYRNIFWGNPSGNIYPHELDSISQMVLEYYDAHPLPHRVVYEAQLRHLLNIRLDRGQITQQAMLDTLCRYRKEFYPVVNTGPRIISYFNNVMKSVNLISIMDIPEGAKHDSILQYSQMVIDAVRGINGSAYNSSLLYAMSVFATHKQIHKYLTTAERKHYLESLLFYTQPFTRAHCETVTSLAQIILCGVLDYRPELLIGILGCKNKRQVLRNRQVIIDHFTEGARYHDLGKTRMPYIVMRDTRRLTDHEYSLIKRHPDFGLSYLKVDSTMQKLRDIVLGHHKWYNGKGGYPMWFDNRASSEAVLIDILTLGDCLEAATSRLGRNYRKNKRYEDLIEEFKQDAGVRYNPDLVQLLIDHADIADQLRYMTEEGWKDIYYNSFITLEQE